MEDEKADTHRSTCQEYNTFSRRARSARLLFQWQTRHSRGHRPRRPWRARSARPTPHHRRAPLACRVPGDHGQACNGSGNLYKKIAEYRAGRPVVLFCKGLTMGITAKDFRTGVQSFCHYIMWKKIWHFFRLIRHWWQRLPSLLLYTPGTKSALRCFFIQLYRCAISICTTTNFFDLTSLAEKCHCYAH